jgi:hypothetical protein
MALSSGQDECHGNRRLHLTIAVGADMDFSAEAALTTPLLSA